MPDRPSPKLVCISLITCMLLSACSVSTASPTATTPTVFHTATFGPLPTNTIEIRPSPTPMPTIPATPTIQIRPSTTSMTILPSIQIDATATGQAYLDREALILSFDSQCKQSGANYSLSPDNHWLAVGCGDSQDQFLEIIDPNGKHWSFQVKDFMPEIVLDNGKFLGPGGMIPTLWTSNGRYLFFTSFIGFDRGPTCSFGFGSTGLFSFDLLTNEVSTILSPRVYGYQIAFSPFERYLAYAGEKTSIYDFATRQTTTLDTENAEVGNFTWSPDSSKLAFATCTRTEDLWHVARSSIDIYSLATSKTSTLIEQQGNEVSVQYTGDETMLKIYWWDEKNDSDHYAYYYWNLDRFITPTPTPSS